VIPIKLPRCASALRTFRSSPTSSCGATTRGSQAHPGRHRLDNELLKKYWWPGNIRELENLIERLVAVSDKEYISEEDLPLEFHFAQLERKASAAAASSRTRPTPSSGTSFFERSKNAAGT